MAVFKLDAGVMLEATAQWVTSYEPTTYSDDYGQDRIVPGDLSDFLARLRLLEGVPFCYLVADSELLPLESIRFFYLDRAWTDALVQGALSVGTVSSSDRVQLEQLHAPIRDEIDVAERRVRLPGSEQVQDGPAGEITGMLLRSRAVSGWPGLHVRAYRRDVVGDDEIVPESHPDRIKVLRMERLAPAVLFVLFDGVPALVHVEEPRQGIQFGVIPEEHADGTFSAYVPARDATTSNDLDPIVKMPIAFRPSTPGVIDLRATRDGFLATPGANLGTSLDAAELALQMLRFPYRQVFGDTEGDVYRVDETYSLDALRITFAKAVQS